MIVAPGGLREAMSPASADYAVRWYGRKGFAELAQLAGAPIIPVFTRNIRETFVVMGGESSIVQYLYKLTKLPSTPFFGPIPQKLTSVIGAPLPHVPGMSASDTAQRARRALTALMRSHRRHVAAQYLKFAGTP